MASNLNYRSNNKKVGSFPDEQNDHFPKISEKSKKRPFSPEFNLENGRVVTTKTSDLYPCRLFD